MKVMGAAMVRLSCSGDYAAHAAHSEHYIARGCDYGRARRWETVAGEVFLYESTAEPSKFFFLALPEWSLRRRRDALSSSQPSV
jgi:hypothetical protein